MATKYTAFRCPIDLLEKAKFKATTGKCTYTKYILSLIEKDTAGMVVRVKAPKPKKRKPKKK